MAANARFRLSGGAANTTPANSLGGAMSTQAGSIIAPGADQNTFDLVTGQESNDGDIEYRCIYVENNGNQPLLGARLWLDQPSAHAEITEAIGLDPAAIGADSAITIDTEQDPAAELAAAGVAFTSPTTKAGGLLIGDIPAGSKKAFWERRTVAAGADAGAWSFSCRVEGDSDA